MDDAIQGLVLLMDLSDEVISPVNLGRPEGFTILNLPEYRLTLTESKPRFVFVPAPSDNFFQQSLDMGINKQIPGAGASV